MAFFGDNTILGTQNTLNRLPGDFSWALRASPTQSGSVYQMSAYGSGQVGTNANLILEIYSDDGSGTAPVNRLAASSPFLVTTSMAAQWMTVPISLAVTAGTTYWLNMWLQNAGGASGMNLFNGAFTGPRVMNFDQNTNPAVDVLLYSNNWSLSIYADYSLPAAGNDPPMGMHGRGAGW
jgi:hypothetical protein